MENAIEKAVNWWANKISGNVKHDNGDNSLPSLMACMLADTGVRKMTEEQLEIFREELRKQIESYVKKYGYNVYLGSDYGPCVALAEAADKAGISHLNFPFKTNLVIKKSGEVMVSDGYAEPYIKI